MNIENKTILVTGGTGTLGNALVKEFLSNKNPKKIIVYSRDEFKQDQMKKNISDPEDKIRYFIGDVRDEKRLSMACRGVNIIIHAAALKQVPAIEYNPIEAVKTNIQGTKNVISSALENGVSNVLFISTDKACAPINLYGATKMVAEKLILQANNYSGWKEPCFSAVRYGNVTGSRGSVIPLYKSILNEPYPITHTDMTRFWMTIKDAVNLVVHALVNMKGGEIFIPKMKSYNIIDLVKAVSYDENPSIKITGIRKGEKLHEQILNEDDMRNLYFDGNYYIVSNKELGKKINIDSFDSFSADRMSIKEIQEGINAI